jgi:integrase/recombinase XerC
MIHTLSRALTFYFRDYLARARGVSANTVAAYRQSFDLFSRFLRQRRDLRSVRQIRVSQITPDVVLDFLDHLEDSASGRGNSRSTRNARLAALRSFFKALPLLHSRYVPLSRQMESVPLKRAQARTPDYLEREELREVFAAINRESDRGLRDLALLLFMYNVGGRASEVADARLDWIRNDHQACFVRILGKGNRERLCPLWDVTAAFLKHYLATARREAAMRPRDHLFVNRRGAPFTRKGVWGIVRRCLEQAKGRCPSLGQKHLSAHSIRHSLGMHLLQAGVDMTVIRAWLGHVRLDTTAHYARARVKDAQKAVERYFGLAEVFPYTADAAHGAVDESLLQWLESL